MRPGLGLIAAAAAGALSTLPHVHTEAWWLGPLAAAVLAFLFYRSSPRRVAFLSGVFGTAWLLAGTWWLFISMHIHGQLPAVLAALAVLALSAALALYGAVFMGLAARWRSHRAGAQITAFAAAWLLSELARGVFFTGFPWVASGYAQVDGPLQALAPWVGVYGMGAAVGLIGACLAWPVHALLAPGGSGAGAAGRWAAVPPALALLVCIASGQLPAPPTRAAGDLRVSLLQTNVAQDDKFDPQHLPQLMAQLQEALAEAQGDLVVAPETAIPILPGEWSPRDRAALVAPFASGDRVALVGAPWGGFETGYTNSVVALDAAGAAQGRPGYRYDKHHLVPFGEFIPWGFRWFVDWMRMPLGDFARGAPVPPSYEFRGQRLAPNICYEDLFGEEIARRFANPDTAPTLLVNVSNIAWFGRTVAVDQHLHISRLRALEFQRPMIRATNTGATAIIDHRGQVRAWLKPHTRGVLEGLVQGRHGLTPYARWTSAWGLAPLWALGLLMLAGLAGWSGRAARGEP